MRRFVLYSRPGCHLCEIMHGQVLQLLAGEEIRIETVDIGSDPALLHRYGLRIPVLTENGQVLAEGRLDEADFLDALNEKS